MHRIPLDVMPRLNHSGGRNPGDISPSPNIRRLFKKPGAGIRRGKNSSSAGKPAYVLACGFGSVLLCGCSWVKIFGFLFAMLGLAVSTGTSVCAKWLSTRGAATNED